MSRTANLYGNDTALFYVAQLLVRAAGLAPLASE
jgi:hypothetical protein